MTIHWKYGILILAKGGDNMTKKNSHTDIKPIKDLPTLLSFYGVSEEQWDKMSENIHDQLGFILSQIKTKGGME